MSRAAGKIRKGGNEMQPRQRCQEQLQVQLPPGIPAQRGHRRQLLWKRQRGSKGRLVFKFSPVHP